MQTIFRKKENSCDKVVTDRFGDIVKSGDQVMIHFPDKINSPGVLYTVLPFDKAIPTDDRSFPPLDLSFIKKERILLW